MKRLFEFGGYAAAIILVAFGIAALVLGMNGRSEVRDNLKLEKIEGSDDMYPEGIRESAAAAGLPAEIDLPTCSVFDPETETGELIDDGSSARCFAQYMRIHALESSGGKVYAEMGRFLTPDGQDTSNPEEAAKDEEGNPVPNTARNTWVTETALATALNMAFFAEQVSNFSIVVAIALILAGVGFAILAFTGFRLPERRQGPHGGASPPPASTA